VLRDGKLHRVQRSQEKQACSRKGVVDRCNLKVSNENEKKIIAEQETA